jgi:hypothetical protein
VAAQILAELDETSDRLRRPASVGCRGANGSATAREPRTVNPYPYVASKHRDSPQEYRMADRTTADVRDENQQAIDDTAYRAGI